MVSINVAFFDLGGTLITPVAGQRAQWIEGAKDSLSKLANKGISTRLDFEYRRHDATRIV